MFKSFLTIRITYLSYLLLCIHYFIIFLVLRTVALCLELKIVKVCYNNNKNIFKITFNLSFSKTEKYHN